jgi:site-specific recombinase XerD
MTRDLYETVSARIIVELERGAARWVKPWSATAGQNTPCNAATMLRHACGFALANDGHDTRALQAYLGHRNIQHTVRYTELASGRFRDFWSD